MATRARPAKRKAAKKKTPAPPKTAREKRIALVKKFRQHIAIGARYYAKADELMTEIRGKLKPGVRLKLAADQYAVLVDRFEDADTIWKPIPLKRFELQIQNAAGKVVRLRDSRKKKKP